MRPLLLTVLLAASAALAELPAPWKSADLGFVNTAGTAAADAGTFTVTASGSDIWDLADGGHFVYQPITGSFMLTARIVSLENTNEWAKAGVMFRSTTGPGAKHAFMCLTPSQGADFQRREMVDSESLNFGPQPAPLPYWVRLVRLGDAFSGFSSADGQNWTAHGTVGVLLTQQCLAGLAVSAHNNDAVTKAVIDNVKFEPIRGVSEPWKAQDIGAVGITGSTIDIGGTLQITASGDDIWNSADAFHYVYQPWSGDGQITARVVSLSASNEWAKCGVMFREKLEAGARHAYLPLTANWGPNFQRRPEPDAESFNTGVDDAARAPYWVRLVRAGSTFTAYTSTDGKTWHQAASETIAMGADIYVGVAVTSHDNGVTTDAVVDHLKVEKPN
ncbi:MAG: hypothetical protein IT204_05270 [Fimbriimonadaceae bacterium]|nr:hypothetical protein [Fimbriimonadaceae bacterium]